MSFKNFEKLAAHLQNFFMKNKNLSDETTDMQPCRQKQDESNQIFAL